MGPGAKTVRPASAGARTRLKFAVGKIRHPDVADAGEEFTNGVTAHNHCGRDENDDTEDSCWFTVALANLTVGQNNLTGNEQLLAVDPHFDGSTFVDGRLAFYTKCTTGRYPQ